MKTKTLIAALAVFMFCQCAQPVDNSNSSNKEAAPTTGLKIAYVNVDSLLSNYNFYLDLAFDYYGSKDFTDLFLRRIGDQKFFVERSVPTVLFTSGITMDTNKVTDEAAKIDYEVFYKRVRLIFHWVERMMFIHK